MKDLQKLRDMLESKVGELEFTKRKLKTLGVELQAKHNITTDQIPEKLISLTKKYDKLREQLIKRKYELDKKLEKYEVV